MPINNDQLQTWANAPTSTKAQYTHQQIRKALSQADALKIRKYEVYLQGSYANNTNILIDSDIDVVIQISSTFSPNTSKLSQFQRDIFNLTYPNATYHWADFRQDVLNALVSYFGKTRIQEGNKSIKFIGDAYSLNADVIPCLEHRDYNSFDLSNQLSYIQGIKFWTIRENKAIINYPKVHGRNGEDKNASHRTDTMYKNIVRVIKNIRRRLVENENFNPKSAPSYYVECAIYNVPDGHFNSNHKLSLEYTLEFLLRQCDPSKLMTVSHQHWLFGVEPWQWNISDYSSFFTSAESYYKRN